MTAVPSVAFAAADLVDAPPTFVYVARQSDDQVIYVGITGTLRERMQKHRRASAWWAKATTITVEIWPGREAAAGRERRLIRYFDPRYNNKERILPHWRPPSGYGPNGEGRPADPTARRREPLPER